MHPQKQYASHDAARSQSKEQSAFRRFASSPPKENDSDVWQGQRRECTLFHILRVGWGLAPTMLTDVCCSNPIIFRPLPHTLSRLFVVLVFLSLPLPSKDAPLFRLGRTHSSVIRTSFVRVLLGLQTHVFFCELCVWFWVWCCCFIAFSCQGLGRCCALILCFAFWIAPW